MDTATGDGEKCTPFSRFFNGLSITQGFSLGTWTLHRQLGAGGMGAVWLAHCGEVWGALKVGFDLEPASLDRFYRERSLLYHLKSPRVVRLLDWGDHPVPWYAMECVPGQSLESLLQQGPLPIEQVILVLTDVAAAVTDMHRVRLAHRDLKPANLMVGPQGTTVIDLGLGHRDTDPRLTQEGFCSGSLGYLPPETLDGVFDPLRNDLYALGIILAEMLTGRWIFGSSKVLTRWQFSGQPLRLADGPVWLRDLATDLTWPDPRRRIARVEEVNERLLWAHRRVTRARGLCMVGPAEASRVLAFLEAA